VLISVVYFQSLTVADLELVMGDSSLKPNVCKIGHVLRFVGRRLEN
jgi:hypothetical protein